MIMTSATEDMKPPSSVADKSLATLTQNLPQELFDKIFELVTHVESNEIITITKTYRHPAAFHINRAMRRRYAQIYYITNKFTAATDTKEHLHKWLSSLPNGCRSMIREIRIPCWRAALDAITKNEFTPQGDTLTPREIRHLAITHVKQALMTWESGSGVAGDLVMKSDFEFCSGVTVWVNRRELELMHRGL